MNEDQILVARVAREHWLDDEQIRLFFQKSLTKTPYELRDVLDDPMFNAGIVIGLSYVRSQHTDVPASRGDNQILSDILKIIIEQTKNTPVISDN